MPGATLPADQARALDGLWRRKERQERQTDPVAAIIQRLLSQAFSYPGIMVVDTESPRWYPEFDLMIVSTRVSLLVAATGDVTVDINLSGALQFSVTLPAGDTTIVVYTPIGVHNTDYLTCTVTDVGTDGADLSVGFIPALGPSV